MIMADVFKIVFLVIGTLIVIVSYWLAATALFPGAVTRARDTYQTRPARITFIGAAVALPLFLLGASLVATAPTPLLKLAGGAVISALLLLALFGSAGLCQRIGNGLPAPYDNFHPWRQVLRGGVVLALTFVLPVIGWFGVFLWTLISGVGAALLVLFRRTTPAAAASGA